MTRRWRDAPGRGAKRSRKPIQDLPASAVRFLRAGVLRVLALAGVVSVNAAPAWGRQVLADAAALTLRVDLDAADGQLSPEVAEQVRGICEQVKALVPRMPVTSVPGRDAHTVAAVVGKYIPSGLDSLARISTSYAAIAIDGDRTCVDLLRGQLSVLADRIARIDDSVSQSAALELLAGETWLSEAFSGDYVPDSGFSLCGLEDLLSVPAAAAHEEDRPGTAVALLHPEVPQVAPAPRSVLAGSGAAAALVVLVCTLVGLVACTPADPPRASRSPSVTISGGQK